MKLYAIKVVDHYSNFDEFYLVSAETRGEAISRVSSDLCENTSIKWTKPVCSATEDVFTILH